jgi:DNA-directed RNA polymerase specialized sigma24 family protein
VRECIDQFGGLIWSITRHATRTRAEAEDATQEIFADVWRTASRFDPAQGSEQAFITMIARRRLIDRMRHAAHRDRTQSTDPLASVSWAVAGTGADLCPEGVAAARAVMQLRPELRKVLELGVLQGLSHAEIAHRLQMPIETVKTLMRRGLIQVREFIGK